MKEDEKKEDANKPDFLPSLGTPYHIADNFEIQPKEMEPLKLDLLQEEKEALAHFNFKNLDEPSKKFYEIYFFI